ncbi:MAG: ATP-dependent DNA helicase [Alphaproteobacteria bacterium]
MIGPAAPDAFNDADRLPILVAGMGDALFLGAKGPERLSHRDAVERARSGPAPLVCHAPSLFRRLGAAAFPVCDALELFAFVRPARFCLPTVRGLASALDLPKPMSLEAEARAVATVVAHLLAELSTLDEESRAEAAGIAHTMTEAGWKWGKAVVARLRGDVRADALEVWRQLPEWSEQAPEPPPGNVPVDPGESRRRLAELVGRSAEARPQQADYASAVSAAFTPRDVQGVPRFVLAEAGTGVGKTLGYLAPATLWAEKNRGPVWISTYTRNLQHQIDDELDRLVADPVEKARRVVVRKGRENYLCLLNLEEAVAGARLRRTDGIALGLLARWVRHSRDGDMTGGDFPSWLPDLVGRARTIDLTDHRGECIYSACAHYHRCFIERSVRRARRADIVIANHALVMVQAALGGLDDSSVPQRYVFDEGHHVFDAADAAFSAHLSGFEMAELRRWVLGAEARRGSRARGLRRRAGDLVIGDEVAEAAIDAAEAAARALPGEGWHQRLAQSNPMGPAEAFLSLVRQQVYARAQDAERSYSLETDTDPPVPGLIEAAVELDLALGRLAAPTLRLAERLEGQLEEKASELDTATRLRIEAISRGLRRRASVDLAAWRAMLAALSVPPDEETEGPGRFVDWFAVERSDGREMDIGLYRHWIDPTFPFAEHVALKAHGVVVTSATLRDGTGEEESDWIAAEARTGAAHLMVPATRAAVPSPFDYAGQTAIIVVTDVRKDSMDQVAAAYRELFLAAGGGALGLFTAIARLRAVYNRVAKPLEEAGLTLLAQHVDSLDTTTLVDIFRAERDVCLFGTDAVRDGIDVPGPALRLIVYDRVPWPRPDILHRARKAAFLGRGYDDMIARLRLKQAYGRLVRRADDRGVFVMLDAQTPSRLGGAFPPGTAMRRLGLAEAVAEVRRFFEDLPPA